MTASFKAMAYIGCIAMVVVIASLLPQSPIEISWNGYTLETSARWVAGAALVAMLAMVGASHAFSWLSRRFNTPAKEK